MSTPTREIALNTNVAALPGVGPSRAAAFARLGIRSVADLIRHVPARYEHELAEETIAAAGDALGPTHGATANLAVTGEIASVRVAGFGKRTRLEATIEDGTGTARLTWFNAPYLRNRIHPGLALRVRGKAQRHGDYMQFTNPKWSALDGPPGDADQTPPADRWRPVYPATESLTPAVIERAIEHVLDAALAQIEDHLSEAYREQVAMPRLADAYRMVHRPADESEPPVGRRRLAFDELLLLQLGVMLKRAHRRDTMTAIPLKHNDAIDRHIVDRFPWPLTAAQRQVVTEIASDLQQTVPMNRMLQGDVGSGKTAVALYGMLMAVASGHQACLMAPTEILAEQHFRSITGMLHGGRVRIELLTGSMPAAQRREIEAALEGGDVDIVVGTHALLTESIRFRSLALAVTDEQHRFGVEQRASLRGKAGEPTAMPHVLVMTATPIPRTLSLTVFGDLDLSTIKAMPPGRQPIVTRVVPAIEASNVYDYVRTRLDRGEQAYVVVPAIEESATGLKDVHSHAEALAQGAFRECAVATMHGRLDRAERDRVMTAFRDGATQVLVATTVIEVGVDVPNASVMVIEHADRFGLAQLHQLRGRVGRGERKSLCVLIADPVTEDGQARLDASESTTHGFIISEKDLEIPRPGELFGARQSGLAPFLVADLPRDLELLRMARRDAIAWIERDPRLAAPENALLRRRLLKAHGEALGLGDVG
ncbi:MAG: ATP-dependent DNA helicase RecG [Phycisphaerales bacterium]|nr:ATP-dependent DNA helicase RecG [Phycisphaerales bacterium]